MIMIMPYADWKSSMLILQAHFWLGKAVGTRKPKQGDDTKRDTDIIALNLSRALESTHMFLRSTGLHRYTA